MNTTQKALSFAIVLCIISIVYSIYNILLFILSLAKFEMAADLEALQQVGPYYIMGLIASIIGLYFTNLLSLKTTRLIN